MSLGLLALLVLAGLCGPILSCTRKPIVPIVVGELVAGVVLGRTGLRLVDPANPTIRFLSDLGFLLLMLIAGSHVPLRDERIVSAARSGLVAFLLSAVGAVGAGFAVGEVSGIGHPLVWAVLIGCGSAAVAFPALHEARVEGPQVLRVMVWVTIADAVAIVCVPLVLNPGHVRGAVAGAAIVSVATVASFPLIARARGSSVLKRLRKASKKRGWALDLRISLLGLLAAAWVAQSIGTSLLVPGFAVGLVLARIGGPKRLSMQLRGVGEGFLVPLFFVILGAKLDVGAFLGDATSIRLAAVLLVAVVAVHVAVARILQLPLGSGLVATAQLGVPAAVATLGLEHGVLTPATASAVMGVALATIGVTSLGTVLLRRHLARVDAEAPATTPAARPEPAPRLVPGPALGD